MGEHIHRQRRGIHPLYSTELKKKGVLNQPNPSYRHWETTKSTSSCNFGQDLTIYGKKSPDFHESNILCSTGLIYPNTTAVKEKKKTTEKKNIKTKKGGNRKERTTASKNSLRSLSAS